MKTKRYIAKKLNFCWLNATGQIKDQCCNLQTDGGPIAHHFSEDDCYNSQKTRHCRNCSFVLNPGQLDRKTNLLTDGTGGTGGG